MIITSREVLLASNFDQEDLSVYPTRVPPTPRVLWTGLCGHGHCVLPWQHLAQQLVPPTPHVSWTSLHGHEYCLLIRCHQGILHAGQCVDPGIVWTWTLLGMCCVCAGKCCWCVVSVVLQGLFFACFAWGQCVCAWPIVIVG